MEANKFDLTARPRDGRLLVLATASALGYKSDELDVLLGFALRYTQARATERPMLRELGSEMRADWARWYDSIAAGQPDYGVYGTPWYVADTFACWAVYARQYLRSCQKVPRLFDRLGSTGPIVDLGCGLGLTTAQLKARFPNSRVIGTNLGDTMQTQIAARLGQQFDFEIHAEFDPLPERPDLVFASEFFEHVQRPLVVLSQVLDTEPRVLVVANTFTAQAIGHFPEYLDANWDGGTLPGTKMTRVFSWTLRERGYTRLTGVKFWNGRPQVWLSPDAFQLRALP